jgi:predicted Fe-S protein YdhL (DUF1289 family)
MKDAIELLAARADCARACRQNVPSPCVSICRMNARTGWCEGCYRTIDEIRTWSESDDDTRRRLWTTIEQRASECTKGFAV